MPLLVGTWSPGLAAFAGEAARELKVGGSANPEVVPVLRERIGNHDVGIVLGAVTVVDEDGERARAVARREVAMYLAVVAELDPTFTLDPESLSRAAAGDGAGLSGDDVLDRFAFAGTPAQVAEHAEAVFDAGAGRIDFGTPHGVHERRGVELLCTTGFCPRLPLDDARLGNEAALREPAASKMRSDSSLALAEHRLGQDPPDRRRLHEAVAAEARCDPDPARAPARGSPGGRASRRRAPRRAAAAGRRRAAAAAPRSGPHVRARP